MLSTPAEFVVCAYKLWAAVWVKTLNKNIAMIVVTMVTMIVTGTISYLPSGNMKQP